MAGALRDALQLIQALKTSLASLPTPLIMEVQVLGQRLEDFPH